VFPFRTSFVLGRNIYDYRAVTQETIHRMYQISGKKKKDI